MLAIALGYTHARLLHVATALGVPDLVDGKPRTAREIARRTGADADAMARLLRGLVGLGVVAAANRGRFASTPLSRSLRRDAPGGLRALVLRVATETHWRAWGELPHAVRTGRPAFDRAFGTPFFRHLDRAPENGALFDEAMATQSAQLAETIAGACDFSGVRTVVDVGGGRGGVLLPLLAAHPHLKGILFDRPRALRGAPRTNGRCRRVAGDFFRSVPRGGDLYVLANVLVDWDDSRALRILRRCRRAMADGSRLLVAEMVRPPGNRPWAGAMHDLDLLVLTGGRTRTRAEHRSLCRAAGLRARRFAGTPSGATLIEVVPG